MADIKSPTLLYAKGAMMLVVGILAAVLLLLRHPTAMTAWLLAVAVWGFCRAYYFAFYVIDHYVDPGSRHAGLVAFLREHGNCARDERTEMAAHVAISAGHRDDKRP